MQSFRIKRFRGLETKQEETTQDRTVLRRADGCLVSPIGGICNPPEWKPLWEVENWSEIIQPTANDAGLSEELSHFVVFYNGTETYLVLWDFLNARPQLIRGLREGLMEMHAEMALDAEGWEEKHDIAEMDAAARVLLGPAIAYIPEDSKYHNFTPGLRWYASTIGDRQFIGNGVDPNLCWHEGRIRFLGPDGPGRYDEAKIPFPPCTSFVRADGGEIYAAGNLAQPLRIWVTARPNAVHEFYEGIYSLERSYVDCRFTRATRITALSHYQQVIVAHTDAGAVYYAGFESTTDGYRARQRHSPVNAGAVNPDCVADTEHSSYFFGRDREIYKDHAVRAGSHDKAAFRDEEIATARSSGDWNRDMAAAIEEGFTAYDRVLGHFWVFAPMSADGMKAAYVYHSRGSAITGPIRYPDLVLGAMSPAEAGPSSRLTAFDAGGGLVTSDLADVGERRFSVESRGNPLEEKYEPLESEPVDAPCAVGITSTGGFVQRIGNRRLVWASPWDDPQPGVANAVQWFANATLSVIETSYLDFSQPTTLKDFENCQVTFDWRSRAHVAIFAESEGRSRGRFIGSTYRKENHRVRLNRKGERIRLRFFVISFNDAPALLRDTEIFYLRGIAR